MKGSMVSVTSKRSFDEKSLGRSKVSSIRDGQFDDNIAWSDYEKEKPYAPND